jgi:hypothetical protein
LSAKSRSARQSQRQKEGHGIKAPLTEPARSDASGHLTLRKVPDHHRHRPIQLAKSQSKTRETKTNPPQRVVEEAGIAVAYITHKLTIINLAAIRQTQARQKVIFYCKNRNLVSYAGEDRRRLSAGKRGLRSHPFGTQGAGCEARRSSARDPRQAPPPLKDHGEAAS